MTILYKCDECGAVGPATISGGSSPTPVGHVYVTWTIDKGKHLCFVCLSAWFAEQAKR